MSRHPPIPPSSFSPEQQKAAEQLSDFCSKACGENGKRFIWKDENGSMIALGPSLDTPSIVHPSLMFLAALGRLPGLPAEAHGVAILATGSTYQAAYELYFHVRRAAATTNLAAAQIEAVKNGTKPSREDALDEQCEVTFDVALELSTKRGPMSEVNWKRAEQASKKEGAGTLIQYRALYANTGVILNATDAPVPE